MKKNTLILISVLSVLLIFPTCQKDDDGPGNDSVQGFSSSINNVYDAQYNFIVKNQEFETVDFTSMPIDDVKPYVDEYVASAQKYLDALNQIVEFEQKTKSTSKHFIDGPDCSLVDFVPTLDNGIGPGLVKGVGDIVKKNNEEMAQIHQDWKDGLIDDNEYLEKTGKLPQKNGGKALALGVGAIMGTGAAIVTGAVVGTVTAPAIATIAVVGGAVGVLTTWYASWTMNNKDGDPQYFMLTGKTEVGGSIPLTMFGDNSNIVVSIDGHAPVAIQNFMLPAGGINKTIEIDAVKLEDAEWGGSTEVCLYEEPMTASSCTEVQFVSGSPSPSDPGPGEGVTVTATLVPPVADCSISFSIVGTDGYSNSATNTSNASGQATFYIPGGAAGVVDNVTITSSNGKTYTVTYVF